MGAGLSKSAARFGLDLGVVNQSDDGDDDDGKWESVTGDGKSAMQRKSPLHLLS